MRALRTLAISLTCGLVLCSPAAGRDIAAVPAPVTLAADAGVLAWAAPQPQGGFRFTTVSGDEPPHLVGPTMRRSPILDVARDRSGHPAIIWTSGCSLRKKTCAVNSLSVPTGRTSVLTRIPYTGGYAPAVTQRGRRLAYTLASFPQGRTGAQCDVPYTPAC